MKCSLKKWKESGKIAWTLRIDTFDMITLTIITKKNMLSL